MAISHDGRHIAYGHGALGSTIILRSLDQFVDTPLSGLGTQPRSPFFSADDKWLGYFAADSSGAGGRLMKVPVGGGPPIEIAPVTGNLRGASWGADGSIVFGDSARASGLMRVSAGGGQPEMLTKPNVAQNESDHLWPMLMPDGKHLVFAIARRPDDASALSLDLAVLDLSTRQWRVIKSAASYPRLVSTGQLLYANAQGIFAAPFDPVACEFRGDGVRVIEGAAYKVASGGADIDVSDNGSLAFIAGAALSTKTLAWVAPPGVVTPIPAPPHDYLDAVLSPDRNRIAVAVGDDGGSSLGVFDMARGSLTQVLPAGVAALGPVWSADGRSIYYRNASGASQGVYRASADGAGAPELVLARRGTEVLRPTSVTPDGLTVLVTRSEGTTSEILQVNLNGKPEPKRIVNDGNWSTTGQISPDGRWLAYTVRSTFGGNPTASLVN